jgi:hypothetical protein
MGPALRDKPIPVNCPQGGEPMSFYDERTEVDAQGRPHHVRVYFCYRHGFFHFSDRKQLTPGV